jgi:TM2 domain-containing membrane protein YozV
MALVKCPDCGRDVSTEAPVCPGCGRPMKPVRVSPTASPAEPPHYGPQYQPAPLVVTTTKSRGTFIALGLFLGCLGIHNFYAGYNGKGAAQLVITIVLGWLVVGLVITGIWALVEVLTVRVDAKGNPMT